MNELSSISSDFDILFRNLFDTQSAFNTVRGHKSPHPVDIYEDTEDGLVFEIACTGLKKEDVEINIEHDILRVSYTKPSWDPDEEKKRQYQINGITRRSFDLAYRVASKFSLAKSKASMKDGLLVITLPFADEAKPKKLLIN